MARHVRRLARRVPLCLALGLATTVALAWALALWLPHHSLTRRFNAIRPAGDDRFGMVWVREFSRPGMIRREWRYDPGSSGGGATRLDDMRAETVRERKPDAHASYAWGRLRKAVLEPQGAPTGMEDARGWPWPALWCGITAAGPGFAAEGGMAFEWRGAALSASEFRAIPLRPIWRGLALDTALWAAAWLVAAEGAWWARRLTRHRRGLCLECAYDLRGSVQTACPECGEAGRRRPCDSGVPGV